MEEQANIDQQISRLLKDIRTFHSPVDKAQLQLELAELYLAVNKYPLAITTAKECAENAEIAEIRSLVFRARLTEAETLNRIDKTALSQQCLDSVEPLITKVGPEERWRWFHLGGLNHRKQGKHSVAQHYFQSGLREVERANSRYWTGFFLADIAYIDFHRGNYPQALVNFLKAASLARQSDSNELKQLCASGLGATYLKSGRPSKALDHFKEALQIAKRAGLNDQAGRIKCDIGDVYYQAGNFREAGKWYHEASRQLRMMEHRQFYFTAINQMAKAQLAQGELQEAYEQSEIATKVADQLDESASRISAYSVLAMIHYEQGRYQDSINADRVAQELVQTEEKTSEEELKRLVRMARCQFHLGENEASEKLLSQAEAEAKQNNTAVGLSEISFFRYQLAKREGKLEEALSWLEQHKHHLENSFTTAGIPMRNSEEDEAFARHERNAEELRKQHEIISRSNKELKDFAELVSLDLKAPLRNINSFAQLFLDRYAKNISSEGSQYLEQITSNAAHMQLLLDELRHFALTGSNSTEPKSIELEKLVATVIGNLQSRILEHNAKIETPRLPTVLGHKSDLMQLFQNLISNAIKFRHPDREPIIQVTSWVDESFAHITVADNGIGIEPDKHEEIFGIFRKLHLPEEYPGTGMGLAICKKIVRGYGGEISVSSVPGQGSVFNFNLPLGM